ncbi:GlxA family transcriptional regulator [Ruegeria sp.]|uniref:GlxA family transcriptional regulator n=1 Tax=Ruegeria sp. TaxID=1879320 RepID=UPI003B5C74A4
MADRAKQGDLKDGISLPSPMTIQFIAIDGFSMMALSSAIEPLRAANRLLGETLFSWSLFSDTAGHVTSSSGMEIPAEQDLENAALPDLTIIVASFFPSDYRNTMLFSRLRRLRATGRMIGAISSGTYLLARAGVLGDQRVTIHWETARELEMTFPDVKLSPDIYCWDRNVLTSAGGAAAMDLMLALIARLKGDALANDVAEQFLHGQIRPSSHEQRQDVRWRFRVNDPRLLRAIEIMQSHLSQPKPIPHIAARVGVSDRQLSRLFQAGTKMQPSKFYLDLRLRAARGMILGSTESLESIAELCGFSSLGHFSRSYKSHFNESPSETRRQSVRRVG